MYNCIREFGFTDPGTKTLPKRVPENKSSGTVYFGRFADKIPWLQVSIFR
jgi:hypothetical protein